MKRPVVGAAIVCCLVFSGSFALAQNGENQDQKKPGLKGIHMSRGVGGMPNTASVTDGKIFLNMTEEEYRERGYMPAFDKLPERIVQRVPVRQDHPGTN